MSKQDDRPNTITFENRDTYNQENIEDENDPNHKWEALNLKPALVKGIYAVGFEHPSFIQKKAIPYIAEGRDLRAQAQSGTGKTGAFVIGGLQNMDENLQKTQVLVVVSTREIAAQNAKKFEEIGSFMNTKVCLLSGGSSIQADKETLSKNPHVVVGTPGRINHMLEMGALNTEHLKIFILDEADEMLKQGFEEQVKQIYIEIKSKKFQSLLFSATYSEADLEMISKMVESPVEIDLRCEDQTLKGIQQFYVDVGSFGARGNTLAAKEQELNVKICTLIDIFKDQVLSQIMIFINRKEHALAVHKMLNENSFKCELITSDFDQSQRNQILDDFKSGKTRILVSSGLCKRGIDVQNLSVVVCLDVPRYEERNDFIHRVGRSGRYGRKGIALHILSSYELETLKKICENFHTVIAPLPNGFSFKN